MNNIKIKLIIFGIISACLYLLFSFYQFATVKDEVFDSRFNSINKQNHKEVIAPVNSESTSNTQSLSSCDPFLNDKYITENSREIKKGYIYHFFDELNSTGMLPDIIDYIAYKSGSSIYLSRDMRIKNSYKQNQLMYQIDASLNLETAPMLQQNLLFRLIHYNQNNELLEAIENDEIDAGKLFSSRNSRVSLIGYIIASKIKNKDLLINQLLDTENSLTILFADLVLATKYKLALDTIIRLYQLSNHNAADTFTEFGDRSSLALIAIKNIAPEIALYWLSEGSSAEPDIFGSTALDLLAKKASQFSSIEFNELLDRSMELNTSAAYKSTIETLSILSTKEYNYRHSGYSRLKPHLTSQDRALVKSQVLYLHKLILDGWTEVKLTELSNKCLYRLGRRMVRELMKKKKNNNVKRQNNLSNTSSNSLLQDALVSYQGEESEIENYLAGNKGLQGKRLLSEYRMIKLREKTKNSKAKI